MDKFVGVHAHPETGNNIVAICAYGVFSLCFSLVPSLRVKSSQTTVLTTVFKLGLWRTIKHGFARYSQKGHQMDAPAARWVFWPPDGCSSPLH